MIVANSGIQAHTSSLLLNDITNGFCVSVSVASVGQTHARPCRLVHKCSTLSSPRSFSADQGPNKWQPDKRRRRCCWYMNVDVDWEMSVIGIIVPVSEIESEKTRRIGTC